MRILTKISSFLIIIMLFILINSCSLFSHKERAYQKVLLNIESLETANGGRAFYLAVFKNRDEKKYTTLTYNDALKMILNNSPEDSFLTVKVILPGKNEKIYLYTEKYTSLAIYAFFTNPSPYWKILIKEPLQKKYKILVDGNRLTLK